MTELEMNLEAAQAAHAETLAKVAKLEERRAAAEAAHADAVSGRARLVDDAAGGYEVHPKALAGAAAAIASAKETLTLWVDAKGRAVADAEAAQAPVREARRAIALARFGHAARARIAAADKLMQAGRAFGEAYDQWLASASGLHAVWTPDCPAPFNVMMGLPDERQGAYAVPKRIQDIIISTGSSVEIDLGKRERNACGGYAAPDDAADATTAAA